MYETHSSSGIKTQDAWLLVKCIVHHSMSAPPLAHPGLWGRPCLLVIIGWSLHWWGWTKIRLSHPVCLMFGFQVNRPDNEQIRFWYYCHQIIQEQMDHHHQHWKYQRICFIFSFIHSFGKHPLNMPIMFQTLWMERWPGRWAPPSQYATLSGV